MEIREISGRDEIAETAALAKETWTEHYGELLGPAQVAYMLDNFQSERPIAQSMREGTRYFWICEGAAPAGYFAVKLNEPRGKLFLSKIYILKPSRGCGYAREAFRFLNGLCADEGLRAIWLTVNKRNTSVEIYKKLGFAITDSVVKDIDGGFVMDDFIMESSVPLSADE